MVKKPKLEKKELYPEQLHQYLSGLPNWEFTKESKEYIQKCIKWEETPNSFRGIVEFKGKWDCKFSHENVQKEILDEFKQGERFKTIYSAEVKITKGLQDHSGGAYSSPDIFQQYLREHLRCSALREIAKKHSLQYNVGSYYEPVYWGHDNVCGETHYRYLALAKLIFSHKGIDSIFQATKEWEELLDNKKYQNLFRNIPRKIQKDLKTIVNEVGLQK